MTVSTGGGAPRTRFPAPVLVLTVLLAVSGAAAGVVATGPDTAAAPALLIVVSLLAVLIAADFLQIQFNYRDDQESLDLYEAVLTPVVFALPGVEVVALTVLAKAAAQTYRSRRHGRIPPIKIGFNVAQWMCAAGVASLVFATARGHWPAGRTDIPALMLAMLAATAVNNLAIAAVRWLASDQSLLRTLRETLPTFGPGLLGSVTNLCIGVLFVAAYAWLPEATPLWAALLWLLHQASRGHAATLADRDRLRGMQQATHRLTIPVDPKDAIPDFLEEVRRCFGARGAELILVSGNSRTIHRRHAGGPDPNTALAGVPAGVSAYTLLHEGGDTTLAALLTTFEVPARVRVGADLGDAPGARLHDTVAGRLREHDLHRCLVAPLRSPGRIRGVLCVYDQTGFAGFEEGELAVLETLAGEMSSGLERSMLLETILRERSRYSDIVNRTSDGIATISPDGTVRSWNPAFERISGFRAVEMTGRQTLDVLHPRDTGDRPVTFERWNESDYGIPAEVQIITKRDERRWLSCSATKAPASEFQGMQLILTARDVTHAHELRRAEQALRDSEARFKALVQHSSDMIVMVDADARITYLSPASRRVVGAAPTGRRRAAVDATMHTQAGPDGTLSSPEVAWIGYCWLDLVHPEDTDAALAWFETQLTGEGAGEPIEFRVGTAPGPWRHVEVLANSMLHDPAVNGVVLNARDVTDRKRADALLAGQVRILDLIARDAPLSTTLRELGRFFEAQAEGTRCLVLVLDQELRALRPAGDGRDGYVPDCPGHPPGSVHIDDDCPVTALCRAAVARRAHVIVGDTQADPDWRAWTVGGETPNSVWAAWAMPIIDADPDESAPRLSGGGDAVGEVLGAVAVLRDHRGTPAADDLQSLDLVGHLAEIAIERTRAHDQLAHQAAHDTLTDLPNRSAFIERSAQALARTERSNRLVAVLFLDLDRFKFINDSFGHDAGDRLLKALAKRLQETVRPEDTLARFGGDEFTILCEGLTDEKEAVAIADRISEVLAKPFQLDEGEVFATCSIGISIANGPHQRPEMLVENADAAMYRAKARGGNRQEVFDQAVRAHAKHRLSVQNSLYRALERHEFRVFYQPAVRLETGEVVGVEALVRWMHPKRGLIGPEEFIGVAEETGLIVPIGAQILRDACEAAAGWRTAGPGGQPLTISVNLSARQFAHPDLVGAVAGILAETGTDPATVRFEITESILMEDAETTNAALRELKALGVCLSIDDFGTGYSSLTYLKRFPVDELKVDRSFVDGLGTDPEDSAIVAAVVTLAHTLDLAVVAEGVETAEQSRHLRDLGCDTAQGFYFGRAVPPERMDLSRRQR